MAASGWSAASGRISPFDHRPSTCRSAAHHGATLPAAARRYTPPRRATLRTDIFFLSPPLHPSTRLRFPQRIAPSRHAQRRSASIFFPFSGSARRITTQRSAPRHKAPFRATALRFAPSRSPLHRSATSHAATCFSASLRTPTQCSASPRYFLNFQVPPLLGASFRNATPRAAPPPTATLRRATRRIPAFRSTPPSGELRRNTPLLTAALYNAPRPPCPPSNVPS